MDECNRLTTKGADTRMETFISHLVRTRWHKRRSRCWQQVTPIIIKLNDMDTLHNMTL